MSGDVATRTECGTDVHFAETRSAVSPGELPSGEFSCDSCPENYNLENYFLNFNSISHFWASVIFDKSYFFPFAL